MPRLRHFAHDPQEVDLEVITSRIEENFPDLATSNGGVRKVLDDAGVSVEAIATKLSLVFHNASDDKTLHDIGKTFLQMHGVLKDAKQEGISINLVIADDAKVMNILNPSR